MVHDINVPKLVADLVDHEVALDVLDAVLLESVVEETLNLPVHEVVARSIPPSFSRVLVDHYDGTEKTVLLLFPAEEGDYNLLELLILDVGNIDLKL